MKLDTTVYGTRLTYRFTGTSEVKHEEFWDTNHAERAQEFAKPLLPEVKVVDGKEVVVRRGELDYHYFTALQKKRAGI